MTDNTALQSTVLQSATTTHPTVKNTVSMCLGHRIQRSILGYSTHPLGVRPLSGYPAFSVPIGFRFYRTTLLEHASFSVPSL